MEQQDNTDWFKYSLNQGKDRIMPIISTFYGIIIRMFISDNDLPYIGATYREFEAIYDIKNIILTEGKMPRKQNAIIIAWMEIYNDELLVNWELSKAGVQLQKISPLNFNDNL